MLRFQFPEEIGTDLSILRISVDAVSPPLPFNLFKNTIDKISNLSSTVLEFPMCGIFWEIPFLNAPSLYDYDYLKLLAKKNNYNVFFDEETLSYYYCINENDKLYIGFFDTLDTLAEKCRYALHKGIRGILPWPYGINADHLWQKVM